MSRILALLLFLFCVPARACLWDNDTLEAEAKGIPDTIAVIAGRFERNPDLYYQMRLARVAKEIESNPDKLELYDDAGVACDRLHRGDEAIAWMEKKGTQIEKQMEQMRGTTDAGVLREHRYRYLANLGTFLAHRWLRNGADRKKIGEMKRARDLIREAITLNPDAHFGREKYQLKAMEWIIGPPRFNKNDVELPNLLGEEGYFKEASKAVKGLSGLIVLGDAWQSADVFNALAKAIQNDDRRSSPAYMARLRACEIVKNGGQSMLPGAPTGNALKKLLIGAGNRTHYLEERQIQKVERQFKQLRNEAEDWHAQRTAYMMERLKAGRHPDTDKEFWNEWSEPTEPSIYNDSSSQARQATLWRTGVLGIAVLALMMATLKFARTRKNRSTP